MVKNTKDKEWFYIDKAEDLFVFIGKHFPSDTMAAGKLFEGVTRYGTQRLGITPKDKKVDTADYVAQRINTLSKVALKVPERRENIINGFAKNDFVWINREGGYNFIKDLHPISSLQESAEYRAEFTNEPILKSEILFLENDKSLTKWNTHTIQRALHRDNYPLKSIESYSEITMLYEAMTSGVLKKALDILIEKHKKITICFTTAQPLLQQDQAAMFKSMSHHLAKVYYTGDKKIGQQLTSLGIPFVKCD